MIHLNPGCCRFQAGTVEQFGFVDRESRCKRMDASSYVSVQTTPARSERFLARVRWVFSLCCGAQLPAFRSVVLDTVLLDKPTSSPMATKSLDQRIVQTSDVCGGKPRIAGHRITVQNIAIWYDRLGRSADEIASEYDLELADIYAALAYYFAHRKEIDQSIRESKAFVEELRRQPPSKLQQKLEGKG